MKGLILDMITCYVLIQGVSSFTLSNPARTSIRLAAKITDNEGSDFPFEDTEYTGSVDWDAEWKKVVKEKTKTKDRPGSRYYKTEAEIAAIVRFVLVADFFAAWRTTASVSLTF